MQVIQCLYKIGVHTFPLADFVKFSAIRTVLPSYYNHNVSFRCNGLCRSLSLFCSITDSVHNTIIVTFFFKNFNYILKFIVVICRLRHNTKLFAFCFHKIFCLFGSFQNGYRALTPADDTLYFRMFRVPHDDHMIPFCAFLFHDTMDLFHKGAGGINALQTIRFHDIIDFFCHSVGTNDHSGNILPGFQAF